MKRHTNIGRVHKALSIAILASLGSGAVHAQPAKPARDFDAEITAAIRAAKKASGFEFTGALARVCVLPQSGGVNNTDVPWKYVSDPSTIPPRSRWYADPIKVFDNFYFVGGKEHSSWAMTTKDGIILFETTYPYNSEELVIGGMKRLGLDPNDVKYLVIAHGHGDHLGGAEVMQKQYPNMRLVMGGPDWDLVEKFPKRYLSMAPKRDITATDGMKLTLGESTISIWHTPGHTPGTLSYTFTVQDRGRPVNVAYSGGTAFNFVNNVPDPGIKNFQIYIDSQRRFAQKAAESKATVMLSNHSEFDNAYNKNRMLAGRGDGPHPYEGGAEQVQRYLATLEHCARAAQIKLEQQLAQSSAK